VSNFKSKEKELPSLLNYNDVCIEKSPGSLELLLLTKEGALIFQIV